MDNSSNTAELGDVLVDDLAKVLDKNFGYKGRFAHWKNRPDAPNPLLTIADIGSISIPLSESDAKRIIACATPLSLGISTIIDPSLVSFQNPAWNPFLQSNIANISSGIGLPGGYEIRYKLHELLVYETGSSRLYSDCDIQKEKGMFATMLIVLPSQHTGGEIIVSHGSISFKVVDISASCTTSTIVLSWYNDVEHRVEPITSGYRLVLSYHLIRRSLSRPEIIPTADNTIELHRLYEILDRWRIGGYKQLPKQHMVALVLGHQYSESDLDMGQAALKGQDAHKVNQICSVAQLLGFELWLAKSRNGGYNWRQLEVETDYESDDGGFELCKFPFQNEHVVLGYFTDLKGSQSLGDFMYFDDESLFMSDLGYLGRLNFFNAAYDENYIKSASSEYKYHHVALVIFHKDDMDRVMIIAHGPNYGFDKLEASLNQDRPTPENRKIVDLILKHNLVELVTSKRLTQVALRWHDFDLWSRIIKLTRKSFSSSRLLITFKEEMFLAWDLFGFQQVQSSYETIVCSHIPCNGHKIDFIHEVKAQAANLDEQEIVEAWCGEQIVAFVKGFRPKIGSEKLLISIAKDDGIRFLKDFEGRGPKQNVKDDNIYEHIIELFMSEKEDIYASPPNQPGSNNGEDLRQIFENFIDKCIQGVLDKGDFLPSNKTLKLNCEQTDEINRIFEVVELYISTNRVDECATLFRLLWDANGDVSKKLMLYYIPLTLRLRTGLQKLGTSLLLPPFATFARNIIGYYLSQMLGSKTHNPRSPPQPLPCNQNCKTCAILREFLEQLYVPLRDFCISRKIRKHSFIVLRRLRNFISITKVARGRYRVAKRQKFLNSSRWEYRLEKARNLLKSIGDDEFIEQLMGDRFEDLKAALEGKSSYDYTGPLPRHEEQLEDFPTYVTNDSDTDLEMEDEM